MEAVMFLVTLKRSKRPGRGCESQGVNSADLHLGCKGRTQLVAMGFLRWSALGKGAFRASLMNKHRKDAGAQGMVSQGMVLEWGRSTLV
jgi:hypothetical protein